MLRSLLFYKRLNLAVLAGVAVAGTVLTGALMVGDSVRASLRALTMERLGRFDSALVPEHFLNADLVERLGEAEAFQALDTRVVPTIMMRGGAAGDKARASKVQITGIDASFPAAFAGDDPVVDTVTAALPRQQGQIFPSVILNRSLADELQVNVGDAVVLSFENPSAIHRDSVYGHKSTDNVIRKLRAAVSAIIADDGLGRFGMQPHQTVPHNAFVRLRDLQRVLDQDDKVNAFFFTLPGAGKLDQRALSAALAEQLTLADYNLKLLSGDKWFTLESPAFYVRPDVADTANNIASDQGLRALPISTYMVNRIDTNGGMVPYSLMTAADLPSPLVPTVLSEGEILLDDQSVIVDRWTADDLGLAVGDPLDLSYFAVAENDDLAVASRSFRVTGILAMDVAAVDPTLAPDFPGIRDVDNMGDWDPPFKMDLNLIRNQDEIYWDKYRTSPKVFVSLAAGRSMWENRFGFLTAIRFGGVNDLDSAQARFRSALRDRIQLADAGLNLLPLRQRGLTASGGATDFSGLFIAFSFFIIISAALLVGLFFRLMIEQRRAEAGIMIAGGYTQAAVQRMFLKEGLVLAVGGALLGALGGFLYADLMMAGLRNWWSLGTSKLYFHFQPLSLLIGIFAAILVAVLAIWLTLRGLKKVTVTDLIAGRWRNDDGGSGRRARWIAIFFLIVGLGFLAGATFSDQPTGLFFGAGSCLLIAGLAGIATRLHSRHAGRGLGGTWTMAMRNTARQAGRSLVCVTLVACACFVIVAVGLYRNTGEVDPDKQPSGTGGYFLAAEAEVPLRQSLADAEDRADLAFSDSLDAKLAQTDILSLRRRPGDDASCLNLFAPQKPELLGVPKPALLADRFLFQGHLGEDDTNPWQLLEEPFDDGAIPVIADANSVMWILKSGLGKDFQTTDSNGETITLRFVGLLSKSVFQSEILMSETAFQKHFPNDGGYGYFLFDYRGERRAQLAPALEDALFDYGFDAQATADMVRRYHEVENTYISIFQMLGGLGLLLGTLGLGAIIYRNVMERKGEFAAMRAFGFRKRALSRLLLAENVVLIVLGILIGSGAAILAMLPHLLATHADPSILVLAITLGGVLITGLLASTYAIRATQRMALLPALRGD